VLDTTSNLILFIENRTAMIRDTSVESLLCALLRAPDSSSVLTPRAPAAWQALADAAIRHGVAPLLCRRFVDHGWPSDLPLEIRHALEATLYSGTAQQFVLRSALHRVAEALTAHMPVVLLKGAALGATLYPQPGLRPLSDLDLLVPRAQIPIALQLLAALGYHQKHSVIDGADAELAQHVVVYGGPNHTVAIELHWGLIGGDADRRTPAIDWFWKHTVAWQPLATPATTPQPYPVVQLDPTANLLYLAAHLLLQHNSTTPRLIWLYDLHLLLERCGDQIDWQAVIAQARSLGWSGMLHSALGLCHVAFGTPLPPPSTALAESYPALVATRPARVAQRQVVWHRLRALQPAARWHYVRRVVCPSRAYLAWRYPTLQHQAWPVLYLYRWLALGRALLRSAPEPAAPSLYHR
jgi:hypothetical protein